MNKPIKDHEKWYQYLTLTLVDGRVVSAAIPYMFDEGERFTIKKIAITLPMKMPEGSYWGKMEDDKEDTSEVI